MFFQLSLAPVHLGNHNSQGPAESSGKSLRFFFLGEVLERSISLKHVKVGRMEDKIIGKPSTRLQEVLIEMEGLAEGFGVQQPVG